MNLIMKNNNIEYQILSNNSRIKQNIVQINMKICIIKHLSKNLELEEYKYLSNTLKLEFL